MPLPQLLILLSFSYASINFLYRSIIGLFCGVLVSIVFYYSFVMIKKVIHAIIIYMNDFSNFFCLNIQPKDESFYIKALTHRSYVIQYNIAKDDDQQE